MNDKIEIRIAFPLIDDWRSLSAKATELAERIPDLSSTSNLWAGLGMRSMSWYCDTCEEALEIKTKIFTEYPYWAFKIRETITDDV